MRRVEVESRKQNEVVNNPALPFIVYVTGSQFIKFAALKRAFHSFINGTQQEMDSVFDQWSKGGDLNWKSPNIQLISIQATEAFAEYLQKVDPKVTLDTKESLNIQ